MHNVSEQEFIYIENWTHVLGVTGQFKDTDRLISSKRSLLSDRIDPESPIWVFLTEMELPSGLCMSTLWASFSLGPSHWSRVRTILGGCGYINLTNHLFGASYKMLGWVVGVYNREHMLKFEVEMYEQRNWIWEATRVMDFVITKGADSLTRTDEESGRRMARTSAI